MNYRFIISEISHSRGQGWIFVVCVALSLVSLVAINSFRRDVNQSLLSDARSLHGGDVIVRSHHPFTPAITSELLALEKEPDTAVSRTWEFYSVARSVRQERTVLANIKAVDDLYPLYGSVNLGSGKNFRDVLEPGTAVVASSLLKRLDVDIGGQIQVGSTQFTIVGVIEGESQRPVNFFDFGPRVFVSSADLESMNVTQPGSRVHFEVLVKINDSENADAVASRLEQQAEVGLERVATYATAPSRIKRFFDNLLFFLSLISVFTMLLAGVGMQSSLAALFRHKEKSLAIIRALGASGSFLFNHYLIMVLFLSLLGCGLGLFGAYVLEKNFTLVFAGLLPDNIHLGFSLIDVVEGTLLGLCVVAFFSFFPLRAVTSIKPVAVLRKEATAEQSKTTYIFFVCGILLFTGLIIRQLNDVKVGLYFVGGTFLLVALITALVSVVIFLIHRVSGGGLALRQALRSMLRPGNASKTIIVTLSSALTLLLAIGLIQNDLRSTYISSFPDDAPNLFCIDIQKKQKNAFVELIGEGVELFPVIRARLLAINDQKVKRNVERKKRGDSLAREFNLTYREDLLEDEVLLEGKTIFGGGDVAPGLVPVSLLDSVAEMGEMKLGDVLTFNVQGLTVKAQVVSIRSRTKSMLYPFFYFVFSEKDLGAAPQTFFAALKVVPEEIGKIENKVVDRFPNISTINVAETAKEMGRIMDKLSSVITFFSLFSIAAGLLILVSSILATRLARVQEAVFYKILGANSVFVWKVFVIENLILALTSGACALIVAQVASWSLCHFVFDIEHSPYFMFCFLLLLSSCLIVVATGVISSLSIIKKKPGHFLQQRSVE
ncbi:MAG: putative ABC transport system permease protein [Desulforhopalus sp.]|jgi:putative ABC transport system permease protein